MTATVEPCPVCGAEGGRNYRPGMVPTMLRCPACGLLWQPGIEGATASDERYEEGYYDWWRELPGAMAAKRATFQRLLALLERYVSPGRLLDVGSAVGLLLEVARERGWDVAGIEVSRHAVALAHRRLGEGVVHLGRLEDAPLEEGAFDAITMTDVLEHLPDPVGSLRRCRELLAPGGRLLITTPAVGCMSQRLLGRVWFQFKDEHLRLFTPEALRTALKHAGLEIEATGAVRKTLSLAFVSGHFDAYPRAVLTPMLRGLTRMLGPLARLPMPMTAGEMWAIARGA